MKIIAIYITLFSLVACSHMDNNGLAGSGSSDEHWAEQEKATEQKLSPTDYVAWITDEQHGLKVEKTIDNLVYTAQYKPCNYVICEEERKQEIPDTTVKSKQKELDGMQYIDLKIALKTGQGELLKYNLASVDQYQDRVNYFAFGMQKDIQLVEGRDTLNCLLFHYERVYDLAPYGTFMLGFPLGKEPKGDKTLLIFDHGFNTGIVKLFFDGRGIKYLPQLQTI